MTVRPYGLTFLWLALVAPLLLNPSPVVALPEPVYSNPPIPLLSVPPPNTNLYYLKWSYSWTTNYNPAWCFDIFYGPNTNASNFAASGPQYCGSTGCVVLSSNLAYGTTNWFKAELKYPGYGVTNWFYEPFAYSNILRYFSDAIRFPPEPITPTNYVWIGATNWAGKVITNPIAGQTFYRVKNGMLQGFNTLSGTWLNLGNVVNAGSTALYLLTVASNNDLHVSQFMHKQ